MGETSTIQLTPLLQLYEEIEDEDFCGRDEYDTTYPPPAVIPSVNAYSKVGKHEAELPAYDVANNHHSKQVQPKAPPPNGSMYDTTYPPPAVIPSVNAYSKVGKHEAELPAYDVANNHHPKQVQPKAPPPNGSMYDTANHPHPPVIPSVNAYSKVGKHDAELPAYDVANNHHSKQVQPKAPPPNGSLYDTANYPQEQVTQPEHDCTKTSNFLPTSIKKETSQRTYDYVDANEFLSASSSVKHSYDYVDNPIDSTNALPPALAPLASSVYTNTTPGKITVEAESHYDLGQ